MPHATLQIIREEHAGLAAVLRSLTHMIARGPDDQPGCFFDVLRATLFYVDEFPERLHHPRESNLLFPRLARLAPALVPVIARLENEHAQGEAKVRELQHLLLAWELIGDARRAAFGEAAGAYVKFYFAHMRTEESELLPAAEQFFKPEDWDALDTAFEAQRDPLAGGVRDPCYDRLFTRILIRTAAPVASAG